MTNNKQQTIMKKVLVFTMYLNIIQLLPISQEKAKDENFN